MFMEGTGRGLFFGGGATNGFDDFLGSPLLAMDEGQSSEEASRKDRFTAPRSRCEKRPSRRLALSSRSTEKTSDTAKATFKKEDPFNNFKRPQIIKSYDEAGLPENKSILMLGNEFHEMEELGMGEFHKAFRLAANVTKIAGIELKTSQPVVKVLSPLLDMSKAKLTNRLDSTAFEWYVEKKIPIPDVYYRNVENGIWVMEYIPTELTFEEGFNFAKEWLTKSAQETFEEDGQVQYGVEIINDLSPKNLRKRENGDIVVIDISMPQEGRINFIFNLFKAVMNFTKQGQEPYFENLIADFPEATKENLRKLLAEHKERAV